jgi:hypothetical protein
MEATSISQSCHDESCHSPTSSIIPATHKHSSDLEGRQQPNTGDLKDPRHPNYRHRMQRANKKWLDKARLDRAKKEDSDIYSHSKNHPNVLPFWKD